MITRLSVSHSLPSLSSHAIRTADRPGVTRSFPSDRSISGLPLSGTALMAPYLNSRVYPSPCDGFTSSTRRMPASAVLGAHMAAVRTCTVPVFTISSGTGSSSLPIVSRRSPSMNTSNFCMFKRFRLVCAPPARTRLPVNRDTFSPADDSHMAFPSFEFTSISSIMSALLGAACMAPSEGMLLVRNIACAINSTILSATVFALGCSSTS
mmetsp:Transcript_48616/g.122344  ORF Transcript_48616/g.122344 Transcript_48616/m.122344 type:complete len:209 (-) Transcript_48616:103-729(-)